MLSKIELPSGKSPRNIKEVVGVFLFNSHSMVQVWAEFLWLPQPSFHPLQMSTTSFEQQDIGTVMQSLRTQAHSKFL